MQAEHQDDAAASEHRIGAAGLRREAQGVEDRRGGACEMQEGERDHLRRDHQRQDEQERGDAAPAHVGDAEHQRHGACRGAAPAGWRGKRFPGVAQAARIAERLDERGERRVGIEAAARRKRGQQQAAAGRTSKARTARATRARRPRPPRSRNDLVGVCCLTGRRCRRRPPCSWSRRPAPSRRRSP